VIIEVNEVVMQVICEINKIEIEDGVLMLDNNTKHII
jgi:hypothetical protein